MLADASKRQAILDGNAEFLGIKGGTAKTVLEAQKKKYGWVTDALAEFKPNQSIHMEGKIAAKE